MLERGHGQSQRRANSADTHFRLRSTATFVWHRVREQPMHMPQCLDAVIHVRPGRQRHPQSLHLLQQNRDPACRGVAYHGGHSIVGKLGQSTVRTIRQAYFGEGDGCSVDLDGLAQLHQVNVGPSRVIYKFCCSRVLCLVGNELVLSRYRRERECAIAEASLREIARCVTLLHAPMRRKSPYVLDIPQLARAQLSRRIVDCDGESEAVCHIRCAVGGVKVRIRPACDTDLCALFRQQPSVSHIPTRAHAASGWQSSQWAGGPMSIEAGTCGGRRCLATGRTVAGGVAGAGACDGM